MPLPVSSVCWRQMVHRPTLTGVGLVVLLICSRLLVTEFQSLPPTTARDDASPNYPPHFMNVIVRSLPIDPNATLASDIASITHVPHDAVVLVTIKANAKCPTPYLRGRLSGPALVILEWTTTATTIPNYNDNSARHEGRYQVPVAGSYHLEIVAIACHNFAAQVGHSPNGSDYNFQSTCLEDPWLHRITKRNTVLEITTIHSQLQPRITGYWMSQHSENNNSHPVYTRFQPRGCRRMDDPEHEHFRHPPPHCVPPTRLDRFQPYLVGGFHYHGLGSKQPLAEKWNRLTVRDLRQAHPTTICLVGHSHSRTIFSSLVRHHNITLDNTNVRVEWIRARFPNDVNQKLMNTQLVGASCHHIVVAVGQWPASFSGGRPTLFAEYYQQVLRMLLRLQTGFATATNHSSDLTNIWARSVHYNPLNEAISGYCPPNDWRSPVVMDGYNQMIRQAVHDVQQQQAQKQQQRSFIPPVQFLDTNVIVGPLWDASLDWGHVHPQVSHVESLYLAAVVLGIMDPIVDTR